MLTLNRYLLTWSDYLKKVALPKFNKNIRKNAPSKTVVKITEQFLGTYCTVFLVEFEQLSHTTRITLNTLVYIYFFKVAMRTKVTPIDVILVSLFLTLNRYLMFVSANFFYFTKNTLKIRQNIFFSPGKLLLLEKYSKFYNFPLSCAAF